MDAILISEITKTYSGKPVLENISLNVPPGQVVALLGRNGAGKTTLMRILFGLISPDRGKTEILGSDSLGDTVALRLKTGFMTEECHFYQWMTGTELARFLSPMYPTWDAAVFQNLVRTLEIPLDKPVKTLSKGSRSKLMLALTLAPKPNVLILDEPLAGLDAVVREQILGTLIHTLSEQGCTIFLSSHELLEVERISDRVAIISQGKLLLDVEKDALKAGIRRIIVTLETAMEMLPSHPSVLHARAHGAQIDLIVKDYSESLIQTLLANLKVRDIRVEGLSLQEIFISLTSGKEE